MSQPHEHEPTPYWTIDEAIRDVRFWGESWTLRLAAHTAEEPYQRGHSDLGIATVADFYSSRNLGALSLLWDAASREPDERLRSALRFSLTAIAQTFSASKSTVYRHLSALARHGFVRRDVSTGRYAIGVKLMVLGETSRGNFEIVTVARDALLKLRDTTGLTIPWKCSDQGCQTTADAAPPFCPP